jgi:hypothetical protein
MDSTQDGGFKIRSRMIIFKDGQATALCPTCKESVAVPVTVVDSRASLPKTPKLKILVKEDGSNVNI